jgi:hypothetical protein
MSFSCGHLSFFYHPVVHLFSSGALISLWGMSPPLCSVKSGEPVNQIKLVLFGPVDSNIANQIHW